MISIAEWTQRLNRAVGPHSLTSLTVSDDDVTVACQQTAAALPLHYVSEQRISRAFEMLGKTGVAELLQEKLPGTTRMRSGDLGEILATEYIDEHTQYVAPIKRLRWKDTRDMPMRGDDVIGINDPGRGEPLRFLKTEAKSRASLSHATVTQAREGLDRDAGLPSPHTLSFVAERLLDLGEDALSDAITRTQFGTRAGRGQVEHLMFTLSGNAPTGYLEAGLAEYMDAIPQMAVGLHVPKHQAFINAVFESVMAEQ